MGGEIGGGCGGEIGGGCGGEIGGGYGGEIGGGKWRNEGKWIKPNAPHNQLQKKLRGACKYIIYKRVLYYAIVINAPRYWVLRQSFLLLLL